MEKFVPNSSKFAIVVCIVAFILLICLLFIYIDSGSVGCLHLMGAVGGMTFTLILNYCLAELFYNVAVDKGYLESKYFYTAFWLGWIGYLLVIALPDLKLRAMLEPKKNFSSGNLKKSPPKTVKSESKRRPNTSSASDEWQILETDEGDYTTPSTPLEHFECALTYQLDSGLRGYLNMIIDYPEMKDYRDTISGLLMLSKGQLRSTLMDIRDSMLQ